MNDVNLSEEGKVISSKNRANRIKVYNSIPYSLINNELESESSQYIKELEEIYNYYRIYKEGAEFNVEGTNGEYVPASLKYMMAASLINKEARFMFAEPPDIRIDAKGDVGKISNESKDNLTTLNDLLTTIFEKNKLESILLKAAKDCFIGKRVAYLVNFNEDDGVTISFIPSKKFIYETRTGNPNILTKFVCFFTLNNETSLSSKRIFKKKYTRENNDIYLEESIYDGTGILIEELIKKQKIELKRIPAGIIINDGLSDETEGESDINILTDFESYYSKLNNGDIDAERKQMNGVTYTVDMSSDSTKNLSRAPGSHWDLGSDQNLAEDAKPMIGLLESSMSYSNALSTTLKRVKSTAYELVDVPNIDLETMSGVITSGKALKAIYWPLIIRCKEKMKEWAPQLRGMVEIIIEGALAYPNCVKEYITSELAPVEFKVSIEQNTPLPEDEVEEKNVDLSEVDSKVMSRKTYMRKWFSMTDDEIEEELIQIAKEREMLEDISFGSELEDGIKENIEPYPEV